MLEPRVVETDTMMMPGHANGCPRLTQPEAMAGNPEKPQGKQGDRHDADERSGSVSRMPQAMAVMVA